MKQKRSSADEVPKKKKLIPTPSQVFEFILSTSKMHMLWGDVGTGKSSFAIQLTKHCLDVQKKVFYMSTKSTEIKSLFSRVYSSEQYLDNFDLNLWTISSFKKQKLTIFQWNHLIHRLKHFLPKQHQLGCIIIDEISPLYLLDLSKASSSEDELNKAFIFILATLKEIIRSYHIPILLINRFKLNFNSTEQSDLKVSPFGGKILKYWFSSSSDTKGLDLQINRTAQPSVLEFQLNDSVFLTNYQHKWQWRLKQVGFS